MPRQPKPWFRKDRRAWFVTIDGQRHNLGPDRKRAMQKFHELLAQPQRQKVQADFVAAVIDPFLEWCQKNRSGDTYSRVVEALKSNDPDLRQWLEARRQRIIRILQGQMDFGPQPIEASLPRKARRPGKLGGEDAYAGR